jgi:hypothetical protein
MTRNLDRRTRGQPCGSARGHLDAQCQVLVIMDDGIFRKQAYRGTGCERGSREGVTVSIQGVGGESQAESRPAQFGPEKGSGSISDFATSQELRVFLKNTF